MEKEKPKKIKVKELEEIKRSKLMLEAINFEEGMKIANHKKSEVTIPTTTSPRLQRALTNKQSSATRSSCLCSPTTHVGSFRCRFHRFPGTGMVRGHSLGSNLSELANSGSKSPF